MIVRDSSHAYPDVTKLRQSFGSVDQYYFLSARPWFRFRGRTFQVDNSCRAFQHVFERFQDPIVPSA
jgi:hypothetical protein